MHVPESIRTKQAPGNSCLGERVCKHVPPDTCRLRRMINESHQQKPSIPNPTTRDCTNYKQSKCPTETATDTYTHANTFLHVHTYHTTTTSPTDTQLRPPLDTPFPPPSRGARTALSQQPYVQTLGNFMSAAEARYHSLQHTHKTGAKQVVV